MRIDEFEKMQQNLEKMKNNLENIKETKDVIIIEPMQKKSSRKGRRAVEKKINRIKYPTIAKIARDEKIIVKTTVAIVAATCVFSTTIFAKTISDNTSIEKEVEMQNGNMVEIIENNENAIQLEELLMENISILKSKEYVEEIRPIEFEIEYIENINLPKGEEEILELGKNGTQQVNVIKSYENNVLISENILETIPLEQAKVQEVYVGTSEFLSNNKVHLKDTMYLTEDIIMKSNANDSSNEICKIIKNLDVILIEIENEQWCKVEYEGIEGYVKCKYLTSAKVTPGIEEANRRQKIKMTLSKDIQLNHSTSLTLEDYKKMLSNNKADKNKILEDNAEIFYNMDKKYNINGVFVVAMAIHESAWGTSSISQNKKNLFGYGAYDSSPYESSFSFDTYDEGIELVTKVLVKYYINENGTLIYNNEVAKGSYYNGTTIEAVNIRYASDENWHNRVYSYMEYLYNRL